MALHMEVKPMNQLVCFRVTETANRETQHIAVSKVQHTSTYSNLPSKLTQAETRPPKFNAFTSPARTHTVRYLPSSFHGLLPTTATGHRHRHRHHKPPETNARVISKAERSTAATNTRPVTSQRSNVPTIPINTRTRMCTYTSAQSRWS